jgi:hypothetical protein
LTKTRLGITRETYLIIADACLLEIAAAYAQRTAPAIRVTANYLSSIPQALTLICPSQTRYTGYMASKRSPELLRITKQSSQSLNVSGPPGGLNPFSIR